MAFCPRELSSLPSRRKPSADSRLVGAPPGNNRGRGLAENENVHEKRPILDVIQIESYGLFPRKVRSPADLPKTGEPRLDEQSAPDIRGVCLDLRRQRGPRADEGHVALEHVPQLGEFI